MEGRPGPSVITLRRATGRGLSVFGSQWVNGVELLVDTLKNKRFLPTGCEGIDTLLGGGLREGQLTEIVGPSSSGKTQICLYVASYVAVKHFGSIIFLDTSNSFSANRIASMISQICRPTDEKGQKGSLMKIMSNIHCQSVFDIFSLQDALYELESTLKKIISEDTRICMLIVDSVSSLITPVLGSKDSQGNQSYGRGRKRDIKACHGRELEMHSTCATAAFSAPGQ